MSGQRIQKTVKDLLTELYDRLYQKDKLLWRFNSRLSGRKETIKRLLKELEKEKERSKELEYELAYLNMQNIRREARNERLVEFHKAKQSNRLSRC